MYIEDVLENIDNVKTKDGTSNGLKVRAAAAGAVVGGITGMMIAYSKKKNVFYGILTGAFICAGAALLMVPQRKK